MIENRIVYIFEKFNQLEENVMVAFLKTFFKKSNATFVIDQTSNIRSVITVRISNSEFNKFKHLDRKGYINDVYEKDLRISSKLKSELVY